MLIERQVIATWYKPKEKLPPEEWDTVCTISGRAGNVMFNHAIEIMGFDHDSGWWSHKYEFDELVVHAWCDLEPYKG